MVRRSTPLGRADYATLRCVRMTALRRYATALVVRGGLHPLFLAANFRLRKLPRATASLCVALRYSNRIALGHCLLV